MSRLLPTALRRAGRALSSFAVLAAFALAAVMLVPAALGYERYVITGGSMEGAIERGAIAFAKPVPVSDLRVGDVITYTPPPTAPLRTLVTHRIVWTGKDRSGARAFRTKGDANAAADSWRFTLTQPAQARVAFDVPYLGYGLSALGIRLVRMLVIGLPALVIGIAFAVRLWREPDGAAPVAA